MQTAENGTRQFCLDKKKKRTEAQVREVPVGPHHHAAGSFLESQRIQPLVALSWQARNDDGAGSRKEEAHDEDRFM